MKTILKAENLSKIFNPNTHSEVKAVAGVNLEVLEGEILMIMGPSGSGKTTLLTMLGGLLKPTGGKIALNGVEIQSLSSGKLTQIRRNNIGFIFQSFNLLQNLSALENVVIAGFKNGDKKQKAVELIKKLGVEKRMRARPNDLSGGERQRVAIVRALINDPSIIMADEPTANLDSKIGHEVMKLLCSIGCERGKSIIIVSHDERIKDIAHKVIYMEDGKLTRAEKGKHDQACTMKDHSLSMLEIDVDLV